MDYGEKSVCLTGRCYLLDGFSDLGVVGVICSFIVVVDIVEDEEGGYVDDWNGGHRLFQVSAVYHMLWVCWLCNGFGLLLSKTWYAHCMV